MFRQNFCEGTEEGEDDMEGGDGEKKPRMAHMFCKTLTASDTSTHGGFSVPRRAAEDCFPPLVIHLETNFNVTREIIVTCIAALTSSSSPTPCRTTSSSGLAKSSLPRTYMAQNGGSDIFIEVWNTLIIYLLL